MLSIAVCDDNAAFAASMLRLISDLCLKLIPESVEYKIVNAFTSSRDLLEHLESEEISILFLDIDMPRVSGFEVAEKLCREHPETVIIFVSSFDDFVYSSFEYSPFRFLRKNKLLTELPDTLKKVIAKCTGEREAVVFATVNGEKNVRLSDITFIEGSGNYFLVNTGAGERYKCRGSLGKAEDILKGHDFYRIQQSYIVNCDKISLLDNNDVIMKSGERLSVSRRIKKDFDSFYLKYTRRRFEQC